MSSSSAKPRQGKNSFWTPVRLALTIMVLGLIVMLVASSWNRTTEVTKNSATPPNTTAPGKTATTKPGRNAAPAAPATPTALPAGVMSVPLKTIDGKSFKLSDHAGKVMVVNLWATWCGPCRIETPHLVALSKEYRDRGVEMIGLTIEDESEAETVKAFVREQKVDYTVGYASRNLAGLLMPPYNSIPQSFVILRDGRLLKRFPGFSPARTPQELRAAIEQAIKEG